MVRPRELFKALHYEIAGVQTIIKESQNAFKVWKRRWDRSIERQSTPFKCMLTIQIPSPPIFLGRQANEG